MTRTRARAIPEKVLQQQGVTLLRSLGAAVYVLGTRRPRTDAHRGTCQTPGLPDVWFMFGASRPTAFGSWWEVKARHGRVSAPQAAFADICTQTGVPYVCGDLEALIGALIRWGRLRQTKSRGIASRV